MEQCMLLEFEIARLFIISVLGRLLYPKQSSQDKFGVATVFV